MLQTGANCRPPPPYSPVLETHGLKRRVRKFVDCTVVVPHAAGARVLSPQRDRVQYDEYRDEGVERPVGLEAPAHATDTTAGGRGTGREELEFEFAKNLILVIRACTWIYAATRTLKSHYQHTSSSGAAQIRRFANQAPSPPPPLHHRYQP